MLKKLKLSLMTALMVGCMTSAQNAHAFLPLPSIPVMPTFDGIKDALHAVQNSQVVGFIKQIKETKNTITGITDISGLGEIYKGGLSLSTFEGLLNLGAGSKGQSVQVAKEIKKSNVADIKDPESVKKSFYKMFLTLPSDSLEAEHCYRNQGRALYKDTVIEIYTTATEMEKEIATLEQRIVDLGKTLQEGSQNTGTTTSGEGGDVENVDEADNTNTAWESSYQAYELMDQLLKMTQDLKAMKLQFQSAEALQSKVTPIRKQEAEKLKEEGAANDNVVWLIKNESAKYANSSHLAFAQLSTPAEEDYNFLNMVNAPDANLSSPFAGSEEDLAALEEIAGLTDDVYHAMDIHNLKAGLSEYRDLYISYDRYVQLHAKSLELLKASDQCAINYLGKYYAKPTDMWSGGALGNMVDQHELRKGVSKWLIDTYEVGKAQEILPIEPESLEVAEIDSGIDSKKTMEASEMKKEKPLDKGVKNPNKSKKVTKQGRENSLLAWTIGAEASKDLAIDQYEGSKWGELKKPFDIWHDQKNYYRFYISGKYDNIIKFLERLDTRFNEISLARNLNKANNDLLVDKNLKIGAPNWVNKLNNAMASTLREQMEREDYEWFADVKQRVGAIALSSRQLDTRNEELTKRKQYLEKQEQSDQVKEEIKRINIEITDNNRNKGWLSNFNEDLKTTTTTEHWLDNLEVATKQEAEQEAQMFASTSSEHRNAMTAFDNLLASYEIRKKSEIAIHQAKIDSLSVELEEAEKLQNEYTTALNKNSEEEIQVKEKLLDKVSGFFDKVSLKSKIKNQKMKVEQLSNRIQSAMDSIADVELKYDNLVANAERSYSQKSQNLSEVDLEITDLLDIYNGVILTRVPPMDKTYITNLSGYLEDAGIIAAEAKSYPVRKATEAKQQILALGEKLFYQSSNEQVNNIHRKFIDAMKNMSLEELMSFSSVLQDSYSSSTAILGAISSLYRQMVISELCKDDACLEPDTEYFVGFLDQARDFRAPKEPINEYLPPIREMFYFDITDYRNLYNEKNRERIKGEGRRHYVSKKSVVTYLGRIPTVWKLALSNKAFVEKDIDLALFLGDEDDDDNGSTANFLRGGRYPCILDGEVIDVADKGNKLFISSTKFNNLPNCMEIRFKRDNHNRVVDIEEDVDSAVGNDSSEPRTYTSELGYMFFWAEDYLLYKKETEKVFDRLEEIQKKHDAGKKVASKFKDELYDNASFKQNQLGDFLNFVDLEKSYRQSKEKIKASLDDAKEIFFEELRKAGYSPNPSLNLANEDEYKHVEKVLDNNKNNIVGSLMQKIRKVTSTNDVVQERLKKYELLVKALQKDNDELISLSDATTDLNDLTEQIKTENANRKAKKGYDKEAEEDFEKELNRMIRPFCASY